MNNNCIICSNKDKNILNTMEPYILHIKDYEYGIVEDRALYKCNLCELISIMPCFKSEDLLKLYPKKYSSYSNKSNSNSLFSLIKKLINNIEVRRVINLIPYNGTIIEVGCGNGLFLEAIRNSRPDIKLIGFDIVETEYLNKDIIEFHIGEFENYINDINECDLIYFSNLIEHVIDPKIFLDKCNSLLKVDGKIYGVTPSHNSIDRKIFKRFWGGYHYPRHTNIFDEINILTLLDNSNFESIKISGSYGFWYVSIANVFFNLNGFKKRGFLFAICSLIFLPLDMFINLFCVTGSMTFIGRKV
jgi:SAM-dependent methyltransferase